MHDDRAGRRRIGIDLGGTKIEGVLLSPMHTPIHRHRIPTERERGYAHILSRVTEVITDFCQMAPECTAVGIGTPGSVSRRDGTMKNSNTTCLNGQPLFADLQQRLPCDVVIENDANCFVLAEAVAGAGQGAEMVFGVIMGTGVGGGIVHHGRLLRGPHAIAGEWGHHRLDPQGPACYCGQRGCVECYLAGPAVAAAYTQRTGHAVTMEEIVTRYRAGEEAATTVFTHFLDHFARGIANVINILDPDVIVLGGGLSGIDELYTHGRTAIAQYVFNDECRTVIRRPQLGDSAGVIGAALLT